jgi:hypothetical protein
MLATAWFWVRVFGLAIGIGAFWIGLSLMEDDDQSALRLISGGAGIIILGLAATLWRL